MKNTTKVTIYHKVTSSSWTKTVYDGAFWDDDQAAKIAKTGISSADRLYVSIPLTKAPNLDINKGNDYIVRGECPLTIDTTSQTTISASVKTIQSAGAFLITTVSKKDHGSPRMHHWELGGK